MVQFIATVCVIERYIYAVDGGELTMVVVGSKSGKSLGAAK